MSFVLSLRRCGLCKSVTQQSLWSAWRCSGRRPLTLGRPLRATAADVATPKDTGRVREFHEMPGPKPQPIIGKLLAILPMIGGVYATSFDGMNQQLFDTYGPIFRMPGLLGGKDTVFAYRLEDVETVFRNEGPWPLREGLNSMAYYRTAMRKDIYHGGGTLIIENGPKWAETRSKVNQPMMQPRISKSYVPPIGDVAQEFVEKMRGMRDDKKELPHDFHNELFKWSLESIAYVALDARLGCLASHLAPESEPQRIIDAVNATFEKAFELEFSLPVWKIFSTPTWRKFVRAQDVFLEITTKHVQAAIRRLEGRKKEEPQEEREPSVLERLLERTDARTATIVAQDMLFGGIETTSYSVAKAMYLLSRNQDKQEIIFGELSRLLPRKDSPITDEVLEKMKFMKAVFKESMRMMPVVSLTTRNTAKEIVLSNYKVPAGVTVVMPSVTHRFNDELYPQSRRFIPERWLKNRPNGEDRAGSAEDFDAVSHGQRHPFAYIPFGFGPRSCVGKRFAQMEMEILLAKIVRNFRVDFKYADVKVTSKLINTIKDPLKFTLTDRSD